MEVIDTQRDEESVLWKKLRETGDERVRYQLIDAYQSLARKIAGSVYSRRIDQDVEFEDYLHYALIGLIEAVDRYDLTSGARFATYASYRIKGAILNGIEKFSEKREQLAFRKRHLNERIESISDVSKGIKKHDSFSELVEITIGLALSFMLEGTGQVEEKPNTELDLVFESHAIEEIQAALITYIEHLPERELLIIRYHYFQQVGFTEIASILGVSKGRVSQLHKQAIQSLKEMYEQNYQLDSYY